MFSIDKSKKPKKLKLFLTTPNKVTISKLKHAYNEELKLNHNETNELSFTLPYEIIKSHRRKKYKPVKQIREKFLIKAVYGDDVEWFVITSYSQNDNDVDEIAVQCYSLEHQLSKKKMIGYKVTSYNCLMVTEDVLKNTGWEVGYINPEFNIIYREFDVSSSSKLSFLYDIAETFEAILRFDTVNKTVNFYKEDELSQYKGFTITERKYLETIENTVDSNDIVTRLHITGKDGLGIQSVNPTGQAYIDDFSYFLYPFEMDEKGNVIKSSAFMEDELAIALVKYNSYVSERKNDFANLLDNKSSNQEDLTEEQNKLTILQTELQIILDEITLLKEVGQSAEDAKSRQSKKNKEITAQKKAVEDIQSKIEKIDADIKQLGEDLKMEKHFSPTLLKYLYDNFIHEDEWSDNNKFDPNDLYESGIEKLQEINSPPTNISLDIVNFFEVVSEQYNWDRMSIGDIVRINHSRLGINVKARISSIHFDFEGATISVDISNLRELNDLQNKLKRAFYTIDKINTDYNKRKINWNTAAYNFNLRNDRIKEAPVIPSIPAKAITHKENDNGSVDLTVSWEYPDWNKTEKSEHNVDGFLIYMYSDSSDDPYQFGSQMAKETMIDVTFNLRSYTFPSVPSNLHYTLGIRAYRRVDEDINSDGILMSEIARFSDASKAGSTVSQSNESNTPRLMSMSTSPALAQSSQSPVVEVEDEKPYQPQQEINVRARLNGSRYDVLPEEPENPKVGDIWISSKDGKLRMWNGNGWTGDKQIDEIMSEINNTNSEVTNIEDALRKEIEDMLSDLDKIMENVDSEMERIEKEVIPNVKRAIEETYVPKQDTPPYPVPASGLWWDTSIEPPRMMRWDEIEQTWKPLAPTSDEFDEFVNDMNETLEFVDKAVEEVNREVDRIENEVVPKVQGEVDNINNVIVPNINSEMERIENEVSDDIDKVLDETKIPSQPTPPDEIPTNKLWWDTSVEPPRFMRWDEITQKWIPVALTDEEIDTLIDKMREQAVQEGKTYTQEEIKATEETLLSELANKAGLEYVDGQLKLKTDEIESIQSNLGNLQISIDEDFAILNKTADDLLGMAEANKSALESNGGKITSIIQDIDTINGSISTTISQLSDIDGTVKSQGIQISANTEQIAFKASQSSVDTLEGRVSSTESSITTMAGEISLLASASEVYTRTETDGRISTEITTAKAAIKLTTDAITSEVSRVEKKADSIQGYASSVEQKANSIESSVTTLSETVTSHGTRIGSTESTIKQHATAIGLRAVKTEVDTALDGKVSTTIYNKKIGELTTSIDGIAGRVSNTEINIDTLTGNVSSALSQIGKLDIKADGIVASVSSIESTMNSVGTGANLLPDSSFENNGFGWNTSSSRVSVITTDSFTGSKSLRISGGSGTTSIGLRNTIPVIVGNKYEISFWVKTSSNADGTSSNQKLRIGNKDGSLVNGGTVGWSGAKTAWSKLSTIWTADTNEIQVSIVANHTTGWVQWDDVSIIDITNISEIGTRISSAEGSIKTLAGQVELKASQTSVDDLTGRMSSAESTLKVLPGQISSKVEKDGVISSINQTPETFGINAAKIDFSGLAEFTPFSRNYHASTSIASGSGGRWYRIASNNGSRAHGRFILRDTTSSQHGVAVFEAGVNYSRNPYINLTSYGLYASPSFTKARIVYNGTYDNVYLEIYINNNARVQSLAYWISDNIQESGWTGVNWTSGSIPSGYSTFNRDINSDNVVQGTVDKWKYGNTTLINGGEIYTNSITASQLNVSNIFGNSAVIAKIQSDSIATANLSATKITTGTLNAAQVSVINLSATNITGGTLDALKVNVKNLSATEIISGTLDALKVSVANLSASVIKTGTLDANLVNVSNINASNIKSGTLSALRIASSSITSNHLDINEIFANSAVIAQVRAGIVQTSELDATKITTGTLDAGKISVVNLSASSIISGNLDASKVNVMNLNAATIKTGTLSGVEIRGVNITGAHINSGIFRSLNNNVYWDLDNGNMKLGGSAKIQFTDRANDLYYSNASVYGGLKFDHSLNGGGRPLVSLGVSDNDFNVNDPSFNGIRIHSGWVESNVSGVMTNIISRELWLNENPDYTGGGYAFQNSWDGIQYRSFYPVNTSKFNYNLGTDANHWNGLYLNNKIYTNTGRLDIEHTSAPNQGFSFITSYVDTDGDGYSHLEFRGKHASEAYNLGSSVHRWSYIYSRYGIQTTSDARLKENIHHNTLGLGFINDLETKIFQLIKINPKIDGEPVQYGILAQQLRDALIKHGVDVSNISMLSQGGDGYYGVQKEQLIAPMIKAIQEVDKKVSDLQIENQLLKERVRELEAG